MDEIKAKHLNQKNLSRFTDQNRLSEKFKKSQTKSDQERILASRFGKVVPYPVVPQTGRSPDRDLKLGNGYLHLISIEVGHDFWHGASAHLRHLAASRRAARSESVVCLISPKFLYSLPFEVDPHEP